MIVVDGIDFIWAPSSTTKGNPEELLDAFCRESRIKIGTIRMDLDAAMPSPEVRASRCGVRSGESPCALLLGTITPCRPLLNELSAS
eukprot:3415668-Rhodomonas_salina.1